MPNLSMKIKLNLFNRTKVPSFSHLFIFLFKSSLSLHSEHTNGMKIEQVFEHVITQGAFGLNEEFKSLKALSVSSYEEFK